MKKAVKLIVDNQVKGHAKHALLEFEDAIMDLSNVSRVLNRGRIVSGILWRTVKLFNGAGRIRTCGRPVYFSILMGPRYKKCFPHFLFPGKKSVYLFDAWPGRHDDIVAFIRATGTDPVFFSSLGAADMVQKRVGARCVWIPEAVAPSCYNTRDYDKKDIHVLQFGRRHEPYHRAIVDFLGQNGFVYRYERERGEVVFPERTGFIDGLARSRISICFPLAATDPVKAGGISTMTMRYLQSMASKCLVVGRCPDEMRRLFDYNPVVEVDEGDPAGQIGDILNNYETHISLIERNYRNVVLYHTWFERWGRMLSHMV